MSGLVYRGHVNPIFISGYPLGFPSLTTTSGYIASSDPITVDFPQFPSVISPENIAVEDIFWADIQANHGNSGGPVFSRQTGAVIGMQVAVPMTPVQFSDGDQANALGVQSVGVNQVTTRPIAYNAGIAKIIPIRYVADLLRERQIQFNAP